MGPWNNSLHLLSYFSANPEFNNIENPISNRIYHKEIKKKNEEVTVTSKSFFEEGYIHMPHILGNTIP